MLAICHWLSSGPKSELELAALPVALVTVGFPIRGTTFVKRSCHSVGLDGPGQWCGHYGLLQPYSWA